MDQTGPFAIGTVATFTCNAGFSLNGASATLTCADGDREDNVGTWGGTEPACVGKLMAGNRISTHELHLLQPSSALL